MTISGVRSGEPKPLPYNGQRSTSRLTSTVTPKITEQAANIASSWMPWLTVLARSWPPNRTSTTRKPVAHTLSAAR